MNHFPSLGPTKSSSKRTRRGDVVTHSRIVLSAHVLEVSLRSRIGASISKREAWSMAERPRQAITEYQVPPFPIPQKSVLRAVLGRMQFTLHATRRPPLGASRLVQAMSAWFVKTRRAPSRHSRDARVYSHTTTAMHKLSTLPPPSTFFLPTSPLHRKYPPRRRYTSRQKVLWYHASRSLSRLALACKHHCNLSARCRSMFASRTASHHLAQRASTWRVAARVRSFFSLTACCVAKTQTHTKHISGIHFQVCTEVGNGSITVAGDDRKKQHVLGQGARVTASTQSPVYGSKIKYTIQTHLEYTV